MIALCLESCSEKKNYKTKLQKLIQFQLMQLAKNIFACIQNLNVFCIESNQQQQEQSGVEMMIAPE